VNIFVIGRQLNVVYVQEETVGGAPFVKPKRRSQLNMPQIEAQKYLNFVEKSNSLFIFDTESQGMEGDYGRVYAVSIKPFNKPVSTLLIGKNACDKGIVIEAKRILEQADMWCSFYGKGHDIPLLNTRLIRWGQPPIEPRPHIDMYFQLKYKLKTGRKSQAHLLEFLQDTMITLGINPEHKMSVSPNVWSDLWSEYAKNIKILEERCASDVVGLEALYRTCRHLIRDIKS